MVGCNYAIRIPDCNMTTLLLNAVIHIAVWFVAVRNYVDNNYNKSEEWNGIKIILKIHKNLL